MKKQVLLIFNPKAGLDRRRLKPEDIINRFRRDEYSFDLHITKGEKDATEIVKAFGEQNDLIICCGGDGTLNEIINGVMCLNKKIPIGYIPMGSTNDLATTIGIPADINMATEIIKAGHTEGYDIGHFNDRYFSYVASFGPGSRMSYSTPQKLKNKLGHGAYLLNGFVLEIIANLKEVKPTHIKIEYDGGVLDDIFYFVSISSSNSVAGIFNFSNSNVKLNDGLFEMMLVKNLKTPLDSFPMLAKIIKKDYDGKNLILLKTSKVKLTFDEHHPWTLDGEYGGEHQEVIFEAKQKGVELFCPGNEMFW